MSSRNNRNTRRPGGSRGNRGGGRGGNNNNDGGAGIQDQTQHINSLQEELTVLKKEVDKEREERNFFQLERDKIYSFWEITKRDLDEHKALLRIKDQEAEKMEEEHQLNVKVLKQRIKHLLFEEQNKMTKFKTSAQQQLTKAKEDYRQAETELKRHKRILKLELKENELRHQDMLKSLKQDHAKTITLLRAEFERNAKQLHSKYQKKMALLREEMEAQRKNQVMEIEERKSAHIQELMKRHEKAFHEIKNYYFDITHNNMDLIGSLKKELLKENGEKQKMEKELTRLQLENKNLHRPLKESEEEVERLTGKLANYDKDKMSLKNAKARIKVLEEEQKQLSWEHEVLEQRFSQVEEERDDLYEKFVGTIQDVQQKSGFKNLLLERKLEALNGELEKKEAQLNEVLAASNLDPSNLGAVTKKMDDVLDAKNKAIKELQYELARISKAHDDTIRVYEAKLNEYGIPLEELGWKPTMTGASTGTGPAGLVAG